MKFISFYQKFISPLKKSSCVFYPTCSEYSKQAIKKYGICKGLFLGLKRILRCHPWQKNNIDLLK
ncbi:MAG: membrane protein insertion efficiency factor YidD [Candidatus Paceibacterota bacterium]